MLKLRHPASLLAICLLVMLATLRSFSPPSPVGPDEPDVVFSAIRAEAILRDLLQEEQPHPVGSGMNRVVRDRIVAHFEAAGYEPEIRSRFQCNPEYGSCADIENLDLLKTVGMQAASYLALHQAAEALAEARQFEGFNRLSAFVIHDLKNLIAQLSLVAKNAARHKHNPEFIDDAVSTIDNAVSKMNRLMAQLQSADVTGENRHIDLASELRELPVPIEI